MTEPTAIVMVVLKVVLKAVGRVPAKITAGPEGG